MNYQSDCLCGGECQKPCIAIHQIKEEINMKRSDILFAMPTARKIYDRIKPSINDLVELNGPLSAMDIRDIVSAFPYVPIVLEALVRIIESKHSFTTEVVPPAV